MKRKLLSYLLIVLLTAACSADYFCITNDPAKDLSVDGTTYVSGSTVDINGPGLVKALSFLPNQSDSSLNDALIKVQGELDFCPENQNNNSYIPTECCPLGSPADCKKLPSLENCQCNGCGLGKSYHIPANSSVWTVIENSAIQGQTIKMTVNWSNSGGIADNSPNQPFCYSGSSSSPFCSSANLCSNTPETFPTPCHSASTAPCGTIDMVNNSPLQCLIQNQTCAFSCNYPPPVPNSNSNSCSVVGSTEKCTMPGFSNLTPCTDDSCNTVEACTTYTGGNRWISKNITTGSYAPSYASGTVYNKVSLGSASPDNPSWSLSASGLVFQVSPSSNNNACDWSNTYSFASSAGETVGTSVCASSPSSSSSCAQSCPVPTSQNSNNQACYFPSLYSVVNSDGSYDGSNDPYRITTQTIIVQKPSSQVSLMIADDFYPDNLGGYTVYVSSSCNSVNGNPLPLTNLGQFQMQLPGDSAPAMVMPITDCGSLPAAYSEYCSQDNIENNNAVYYYIPSLNTGDLNVQAIMNDGSFAGSVDGSLNVTVYTQNKVGRFSSMIDGAVTIIHNVLYGQQQCTQGQQCQQGVVEQIWKSLVIEGPYINYLRLLLTLYIIFYGILFLLGTVQISQLDLIIRVAKISVIVALTSDSSWSYFNNNFFDLFINGSSFLINLFTASGFSENTTSSTSPFAFVDQVFQVLFFDYRTWLRILALTLASPLGFVYGLLILWGALNYFLAIMESVIDYIMAILALSILLVLAPIFIPFVLFAVTRELFNSWIKFLFAFSLKPVVLLIGLNILSTMLLIVVLELFSFPICFGCAFPVSFAPFGDIINAINSVVSIGDFFFCIPWYKPWGFSNVGDGATFSSATGLSVSGILLFVMLTTFMKKLPNFVDDMIYRLSDTRSAALKAGGIPGNPSSRMLGAIGNKALGAVGMDSESRSRRKNANSNAGPSNPKDKIGAKVVEKK
jgi:type IV secretory pathway VirB6-like protein